MLVDERKAKHVQSEKTGRQVRDIVAEKADIGFGSTYYNLHKVMLAAGLEGWMLSVDLM